MERLKGAIADKLQQAIEESNESKRTQAAVKATAEGKQEKLEEPNQELRRVWQHFQEVQELVAELSSTLVSVNAAPPEGLEESAIHHQDRGYLFSLQNNQPAALIEFQRAVELDPYLAEAHREIGDIYDTYGRPALAIISYKRFVAIEPDEEEAADVRQIIDELEKSLKTER
ncbi:MAG: hypothetical protein V3T05_11725, partial [Myxococcota bacterium]